jgi:hypothetical protein
VLFNKAKTKSKISLDSNVIIKNYLKNNKNFNKLDDLIYLDAEINLMNNLIDFKKEKLY